MRILDATRRKRRELIQILGNGIAFSHCAVRQRPQRQRETGEFLAEPIVHFLAYAPLLARNGLDQCAAEGTPLGDIDREHHFGRMTHEVDRSRPHLHLEHPAVARQVPRLERIHAQSLGILLHI